MRLFFLGVAIGVPAIGIGALWTFVLGFAGLPGALFFKLFEKSESAVLNWSGLILTVIGQTYVSLIWVAFVVQSAPGIVGNSTGVGKWFFWLMMFLTGCSPAHFARVQSMGEEVKQLNHFAIEISLPLTGIGFFIFTLWPSLISYGWHWVPYFSR